MAGTKNGTLPSGILIAILAFNLTYFSVIGSDQRPAFGSAQSDNSNELREVEGNLGGRCGCMRNAGTGTGQQERERWNCNGRLERGYWSKGNGSRSTKRSSQLLREQVESGSRVRIW